MSEPPFVPEPPIDAPLLPSPSVELLAIEAILGVSLRDLPRKKRARFIDQLYGAAAELEALGNVRRFKGGANDNQLGEKRRSAAAYVRAVAEMYSRMLVHDVGKRR
jgi:hypothetical protein